MMLMTAMRFGSVEVALNNVGTWMTMLAFLIGTVQCTSVIKLVNDASVDDGAIRMSLSSWYNTKSFYANTVSVACLVMVINGLAWYFSSLRITGVTTLLSMAYVLNAFMIQSHYKWLGEQIKGAELSTHMEGQQTI